MHRVNQLGINLVRTANPSLSSLKAGALPLSWVGHLKILVAQLVKNPLANAGDARDCRFDPWVRKIPWKREWLPTPVLLPGEYHGQRSLAGESTGSQRVGHN